MNKGMFGHVEQDVIPTLFEVTRFIIGKGHAGLMNALTKVVHVSGLNCCPVDRSLLLPLHTLYWMYALSLVSLPFLYLKSTYLPHLV